MGYTIIAIILTVVCHLIDQGYSQNDRLDSIEPTTPFAWRSCTVPPEPINGSRKLHKSHCCSEHNISCDHCNIEKGERLNPGMSLIYSCNPGFKLNGPNLVYCGSAGIWYNIPDCVEIRCTSLLSASVIANCVKPDGSLGSCENPGIGTTTKLECRPGYRQNIPYIKNTEYRCNETGYWEPEPIRCIPACGVLPINLASRIVGGSQAMITEFPWHATLYESESPDAEKEFICGASIIRKDLLLTAAHCVYDESTKQVKDPRRYYVVAGNVFRDYNSSDHDTRIVKKSQVKNIYINCKYYGFEGNYALDIALLQIEQPFQFSAALLPICLDSSDHDIKEGATGRVAGFGRTGVDSPSSYILQAIKLPYVPFSQCKLLATANRTRQLITDDKFCAGYTNGTSVSYGDSGGGLVFQNSLDELWYLQGIVSVTLGTQSTGGSNISNSSAYSLYTKVSKHLSWIRDTMSKVEKQKYIPPCPPPLDKHARNNESGTPTTEKPPTAATHISYNCTVPPQPRNGYWKLHKRHCCSELTICEHCDARKDIVLFNSGTILVYSCSIGFELDGSSNSICSSNGTWDNIPKCIGEVRCKTLLSPSVSAECLKNDGIITSCEFPIPGTTARVKCRPNYRPEEGFSDNQNVQCNESGYWEPELLRCSPTCGMPLAISDTAELHTETSELPWHAALYKAENPEAKKEYVCGATVIRENVVVTAARCVSNMYRYSSTDASKYYVVAGNIYQDYDKPLYNTSEVKKSRVKNIYMNYDHHVNSLKHVIIVAVLEIEEPFEFTPTIQPICLNYSVDLSVPGVSISYSGRIPEYRKTKNIAPCILQAVTVTRLPALLDSSCNELRSGTRDLYCVAYEVNRNGSITCPQNHGSAWIVKSHLDGLWYLQGIIAKSGWNEPYNMHLYGRISDHIPWIKDTLDKLEKHQPIPTRIL